MKTRQKTGSRHCHLLYIQPFKDTIDRRSALLKTRTDPGSADLKEILFVDFSCGLQCSPLTSDGNKRSGHFEKEGSVAQFKKSEENPAHEKRRHENAAFAAFLHHLSQNVIHRAVQLRHVLELRSHEATKPATVEWLSSKLIELELVDLVAQFVTGSWEETLALEP